MTIWSDVVKLKNAENGHIWEFLAKIWYLNGSPYFELIVGDASWCKRLEKKESWWWGYYEVPKKAQKGPLKRKLNSFFFIVATKMVGTPSNLKWKFLINSTTIMKKFVALPKRLHSEI